MKPAWPPVLALLAATMSNAANYTAEKAIVDGIEVIRLTDQSHKTEVSVAPSLGNNAYEMKVNGKQIFWSPYKTLKELQAKPAQAGNPFLWPWANRLDHEGYFANGKEYRLNPALKNYRADGNGKPIHGLVVYASEWKVTEVKADEQSAKVTSRLEFWRQPDWMQQFPFAHNVEMTYSLQDGILQVETTLENLSTEAMPVSLGYHTYYTLHDAPRDEWRVHMPAKQHVVLSKVLVPTGETRPMPYADPQPLAGTQLDDVFTGLTPGESGRSEFYVMGKKEKISVLFGPKFPVAVVYAPPGRDFICFEPMAGPTNNFNMLQAGTWKTLQSVAPGSTWRESFWIAPSGF
ncbi:MAG TPA: aldose 1-epimerase [Bryobacteraceae bacterium]|nr:aldose 1-epimerase [Bryobacteraceae bacterium]